MQEHFNSTAVVGDFDACTIHEVIGASLKEYPPFWHSDYVWVNDLDSASIMNGLKESQFADCVDSMIYFWPMNDKYFVTDKGFVFSTSIYEANIEKKSKSRYSYSEMLDSNPIELWKELKSESEYFVTHQIKLLTSRSLQLAVQKSIAWHLEKKGVKIKVSTYKDKNNKESTIQSVVLNKDIFAQWCISGEMPETLKKNKGRNGKEFAVEKDGNVYRFKNKKECFDRMFAGVCSERTFKSATKDKVAGDLIAIKGVTYKVVEVF